MMNQLLQKLKQLFKLKTYPASIHDFKHAEIQVDRVFDSVMNDAELNHHSDYITIEDSEEQLIEEHQPPQIHYINVGDKGLQRNIAYTVSGNLNAHKILLCLPGLLETKESFAVLHAYFLQFKEIQVISMEFVGRGKSDPLPDSEQYSMSLYLSDIHKLIDQVILTKHKKNIELTILGTSMGGVLAMYVAEMLKDSIHQIVMNDVALTVNWSALFGLYRSMKNEVGYLELPKLAKELNVSERAIWDVQLPGHFDLSYKADIWGMNFHDVLSGFEGRLALIYGGHSKICTKRRVKEAVEHFPHLKTYRAEGASHPAPYDLNVCGFIQDQMGIKG